MRPWQHALDNGLAAVGELPDHRGVALGPPDDRVADRGPVAGVSVRRYRGLAVRRKHARCSQWLLDRPRTRRVSCHDRSGANPGAASPEADGVPGSAAQVSRQLGSDRSGGEGMTWRSTTCPVRRLGGGRGGWQRWRSARSGWRLAVTPQTAEGMPITIGWCGGSTPIAQLLPLPTWAPWLPLFTQRDVIPLSQLEFLASGWAPLRATSWASGMAGASRRVAPRSCSRRHLRRSYRVM